MSLFGRFAGGPPVTSMRPVIVRSITYPAVTAETTVNTDVSVPYAVLESVRFFLPPGTNYSVKLALEFSGKRFVPTENATDWVVGSGVVHEFPVGIPVRPSVRVVALCDNFYSHTVYVALQMNRGPIQAAAELRGGTMVAPS